jgi:hypothetical protein
MSLKVTNVTSRVLHSSSTYGIASHRDRQKLALRRCCLHLYTNALDRPLFTWPGSQACMESPLIRQRRMTDL